MNKLTKLLFSVFTSVAIATSAFAGEFAVTGSAKATYTILSNTGTTGTHAIGKGLGISNEFTLSASGELDNGMTWSYAQDIDGATVQDDANIALGTDYGTFKICISECPLSTKYAFDNSAYGIGSDNGYGHGAASGTTMQYGKNVNSYNNVQFHAPADLLPLGMTFKAAITPGGAGGSANDSSHSVNGDVNGEMTQYATTITPVDGLTIAASYYDFGDMGGSDNRQKREGGSLSANYSMGSFSFGYGETRFTPEQASGVGNSAAVVVDFYENIGYSLGFAVNENLSVSLTQEESTKNQKSKATATDAITRSDVTMEIQTIDVAYTIGGATFSVSSSEGTNDSYTSGDDTNEHIFAMSLAF
jgi:hypothetical protein